MYYLIIKFPALNEAASAIFIILGGIATLIFKFLCLHRWWCLFLVKNACVVTTATRLSNLFVSLSGWCLLRYDDTVG